MSIRSGMHGIGCKMLETLLNSDTITTKNAALVFAQRMMPSTLLQRVTVLAFAG